MTKLTMSGALTKMRSSSKVAVLMPSPVPQTSDARDRESGAAMNTRRVTAAAREAELMVSMATTSRMSIPTGSAIRRM